MFSIDTNIVLGIVNPEDRLHSSSLNLLKTHDREKLIIFNSVIKESRETFLRKYTETFGYTLSVVIEIKNKSKDHISFKTNLIKIFKKLEKERPKLTGFLRLVRHYVVESSHLSIPEIVDYLNTYGTFLAKNMKNILREKRPDIIFYRPSPEFWTQRENLEGHIKSVGDIKFRDRNDEEIFKDVVSYVLSEKKALTFFTNDGRFRREFVQALEHLSKVPVSGYKSLKKKIDVQGIR